MTTLGIGGNARYFVKAETDSQIADAVHFASENDLDLFVLGGGSNVLISDQGVDGLVLQVAIKGMEHSETESAQDTSLITAGAGEDWDAFVAHCVGHGLAGVECLS